MLMGKQYEILEGEQMMAHEPIETYSVQPEIIHLDISLDSNAAVEDIKKAIEMIKGITKVCVSDSERTGMTGIDRGLEDIKKGNVFHARNSADLISQIFG